MKFGNLVGLTGHFFSLRSCCAVALTALAWSTVDWSTSLHAQPYLSDSFVEADALAKPLEGVDLSTAQPAVAVGDPNGSPPVTPATRVDPNVAGSPYAGVVSLFLDSALGGGICSGAAISPSHVLTAAHCVDVDGGVDPGNGVTGDGIVDVAFGSSTVIFNHTGNNAAQRGIANIQVHPDWHGFLNVNGPEGTSINDDVAVVTLTSPIPAGVPVYPLNMDPFVTVELITMAGYGTTGDAINGYIGGSASFSTKRTGQNLASRFEPDDEAPNTDREVFLFDMDGPSVDFFGDGGSLGNDIETIIGGGDSGGPSFLWNDDGDSIVEADELSIFGVNTFTQGTSTASAPGFGSLAGGMIVSTYKPFIDSIVPEPSSLIIMLIGVAGLAGSSRRASR